MLRKINKNFKENSAFWEKMFGENVISVVRLIFLFISRKIITGSKRNSTSYKAKLLFNDRKRPRKLINMWQKYLVRFKEQRNFISRTKTYIRRIAIREINLRSLFKKSHMRFEKKKQFLQFEKNTYPFREDLCIDFENFFCIFRKFSRFLSNTITFVKFNKIPNFQRKIQVFLDVFLLKNSEKLLAVKISNREKLFHYLFTRIKIILISRKTVNRFKIIL